MSSLRSLLILYATETGNAQDAADRIARQCRRIAFHCRVLSMDAYSVVGIMLGNESSCYSKTHTHPSQPELISEKLVIFVVSTTGSGTEPRSMASLWRMLLRSDLPVDLFEDLLFAVFGLGDTSYEKFCWPAKKLARRMSTLGATEICERGEGDDQHQLG
jgi:sulfite reductase alpha subunit-like flavoprotein